jgi:mRNA interferase RelE/StbE
VAWTIEYAESVRKPVSKLDPQTRKKIRSYLEEKIAKLDNPRSQGKALTGPLSGLWRYRVGDYRIICHIVDQRLVVVVVNIDHRSSVYRER